MARLERGRVVGTGGGGLVVVPTMPLLRAKELKQIIDKAQVSAALCDARLVDKLAQCSDPANA